MKRKKKKYARCPSCDSEKHSTEMKIAISHMEAVDRAQYKHYNEMDINTYASFIDSDFGWACDSCLEKKRATKGNPGLQNYCWNPHYAYFDTSKVCRKCNKDFVFGKEEKRFWYENLKFWPFAEPENCVDCRKDIRKYKSENKTLSEILRKKEEDILTEEIKIVIEIYTSWQIEQKAKYYQSVLNKRMKNSR